MHGVPDAAEAANGAEEKPKKKKKKRAAEVGRPCLFGHHLVQLLRKYLWLPAVVRFAFHTACGWERVEARAACDRTRWSTQDEAAAEAAEEEAPKKKKKKKAAAEAATDETNGEPVKVRDKRVLLSACLSVFSAPSCTWWASSAAIEHILTAVDVLCRRRRRRSLPEGSTMGFGLWRTLWQASVTSC